MPPGFFAAIHFSFSGVFLFRVLGFFFFFYFFSFVCVDGDSLVRSGASGSTDRKVSAPAPERGWFLSEVVWKEGFEVFEYLLLSI